MTIHRVFLKKKKKKERLSKDTNKPKPKAKPGKEVKKDAKEKKEQNPKKTKSKKPLNVKSTHLTTNGPKKAAMVKKKDKSPQKEAPKVSKPSTKAKPVKSVKEPKIISKKSKSVTAKKSSCKKLSSKETGMKKPGRPRKNSSTASNNPPVNTAIPDDHSAVNLDRERSAGLEPVSEVGTEPDSLVLTNRHDFRTEELSDLMVCGDEDGENSLDAVSDQIAHDMEYIETKSPVRSSSASPIPRGDLVNQWEQLLDMYSTDDSDGESVNGQELADGIVGATSKTDDGGVKEKILEEGGVEVDKSQIENMVEDMDTEDSFGRKCSKSNDPVEKESASESSTKNNNKTDNNHKDNSQIYSTASAMEDSSQNIDTSGTAGKNLFSNSNDSTETASSNQSIIVSHNDETDNNSREDSHTDSSGSLNSSSVSQLDTSSHSSGSSKYEGLKGLIRKERIKSDRQWSVSKLERKRKADTSPALPDVTKEDIEDVTGDAVMKALLKSSDTVDDESTVESMDKMFEEKNNNIKKHSRNGSADSSSSSLTSQSTTSSRSRVSSISIERQTLSQNKTNQSQTVLNINQKRKADTSSDDKQGRKRKCPENDLSTSSSTSNLCETIVQDSPLNKRELDSSSGSASSSTPSKELKVLLTRLEDEKRVEGVTSKHDKSNHEVQSIKRRLLTDSDKSRDRPCTKTATEDVNAKGNNAAKPDEIGVSLIKNFSINLEKIVPRKLSKSDLIRRKSKPKKMPLEIKPAGSTSQASVAEKFDVNSGKRGLDTSPKKLIGNFSIKRRSVQPESTDVQTFKLPQVNNKSGNKQSVGIKRVDSESFNKPTATQATRVNQSNMSFRINSYLNSENTTHSLPQSVAKDDDDEDDDESVISMAVNPDLEKFVNDKIMRPDGLTEADKFNKVRNFIQNQAPYPRSTTLIPPRPTVRKSRENHKSHSRSTTARPPIPIKKTDSNKSDFYNGYIAPPSPTTVSKVENVANKYSVTRSPTFSDDDEEEEDALAFKRRSSNSVEFTHSKQRHANESKFENPPANSQNQHGHRNQSELTSENPQSNSQNQLVHRRQSGLTSENLQFNSQNQAGHRRQSELTFENTQYNSPNQHRRQSELSLENLQQHHDKFSTSPVEPKTVSITNGHQLPENNSDEVLPYDHPFSGYCLSFLRRSVIQGQSHRCVLKHEIPSVMFEYINASRQYSVIVGAIKEVCHRNFSNPPIEFLEQILVVLFMNHQNKQYIETIVMSMQSHISVNKVSHERYVEIWSSFLKSLIRKTVEHHKDPEVFINRILDLVMQDGLTTQFNIEILQHALSELAKATSSPQFKLLACTDFMKEKSIRFRFPVSLYPYEFMVTAIQQFMDRANTEPKPVYIRAYGYRIYKTFFENFESCLLVHKANWSLAEQFLEVAQDLLPDSMRDIRSLIHRLRLKNPPHQTVVGNRALNNRGLNNAGLNDGVQNRVIETGAVSPGNGTARNYQQAKSSTSSESSSLRQADTARNCQQTRPSTSSGSSSLRQADTARNCQQTRPSTSSGSSSYRLADWLREFPPEGVFERLKSERNGGVNYLKLLQQCEGVMKKKCNDITMSFILLESEKKDSDSSKLCHNLFQHMMDFHPNNVQDYATGKSTSAYRLLVVAKCCLQTCHVKDAVNLFLRFGLFEADHSKWLLENSPEDIRLWRQLCMDISNGLGKMSTYSDYDAQIFKSIISHQKSLRDPVSLLFGLNKMFWELANLYQHIGWNPIAEIVLLIVEKNLQKQLNLYRNELYRIIIKAVCNANIPEIDVPDICARLMRRSNSACDIYPSSWNKDCHELTLKSCLTVEELQAFLMFKIKAYRKMLELKSLHITFEEYENANEEWKQPFFRNVDESISGVIERFKMACQKIGLNLSSLIVKENKVIVDRIIAGVNQETL